MLHTFDIPETSVTAFETTVRRLNRFAVKHGMEPVGMKVFSGKVREVAQDVEKTTRFESGWAGTRTTSGKRVMRVVPVELDVPEQVTYNTGYKPVAVLVPAGEGETSARWEITKAHDVFESAERLGRLTEIAHQGSCKCEACKRPLTAMTVIIEEEKTGRFVQAGKECSIHYLGEFFDRRIASMEFMSRVYEYINTMNTDPFLMERGGGARTLSGTDLEEFVATAHAASRLYGYTAKSEWKGQEKVSVFNSTWAIASSIAGVHMRDGEASPEKRDEVAAAVSGEDHLFAKEVVAAWKAMPDEVAAQDEFKPKLRAAAMQGWVSERGTAIVCGAVGAELNRRARLEEAAASRFVGTVGDKIDKEFKSDGVKSFDTQFGRTNLCRFKDESGNLLVWKTSTPADFVKGQIYRVKGTISKHEDYRGCNQTSLTRCKVELSKKVELEGAKTAVEAAARGDTEAVMREVKSGIPIDAKAPAHRDKKGRGVTSAVTPLHAAVRAGHEETAAALVAAGADPTVTNANGLNAEIVATLSGTQSMQEIVASAKVPEVAAPVVLAASEPSVAPVAYAPYGEEPERDRRGVAPILCDSALREVRGQLSFGF